jgi:hypothetical protein
MKTLGTPHTIKASYEDASLPKREAAAPLQGQHWGVTAFSACCDDVTPTVTENHVSLASYYYVRTGT